MGFLPNALHFCCGDAPRPRLAGSDPRVCAGRPRQQQVRVRRNPERAARANPAAAHPLGPRRGRASPNFRVPPPCLILARVRSPGKERRAGPPEWQPEPGGWDAGLADDLKRQPPGASRYTRRFRWPPAGSSRGDAGDPELGAA